MKFLGVVAGLIVAVSLVMYRAGDLIRQEPQVPARAKVQVAPADTKGFGSSPYFKLTSSTGESFSSEQLEGKVWLVNFFFTSCPAVCPRMNTALKKVVEQFKNNPDFRLVSVSIDSETDTVPVLDRYSQKYNPGDLPWTFLRGSEQEIQNLLGGFNIALGKSIETHTTRIILVDRSGTVRSYFIGTNSDSLASIPAELHRLLG